MKYQYPYREWSVGMVFCLVICLWGVYSIYDMKIHWLIGIGYMAFNYLLLDWYWAKIQNYKSKYVKVSQEGLQFSFNNRENTKTYRGEEIEYIFNVNHKQRLKTHNVLHFFMKDGQYYHLTNEINGFEELKKDLQKRFLTKYITIEKPFHGVLEGNKKQQFLNQYYVEEQKDLGA